MAITPEEVWSDLHHTIQTDARGNIKKSINVDAVVTSVTNILTTFQGERVYLPEFASRLRDLLFEPIDESLMNFISDEVKKVIEIWDDRVQVTIVDYHADHDRNHVELAVSFRIVGNDGIFQAKARVV